MLHVKAKSQLRTCLIVAALLSAGEGLAADGQQLDCDNAMTQTDMNICSYEAYQAADKELNIVWKTVRASMKEQDADLPENLKGAEKALLKGQRAWIDYRDGTCEAAGFSVRGGSMEPLVINSCLENLTRHRTRELEKLMTGEM